MSSQKNAQQIATCLRRGGVIALPTETIYGLCCDPRSEKALDTLFSLKQRSSSKRVLCITGSLNQIHRLAVIPFAVKRIVETFWPGPLTIVLPLKEGVHLPHHIVSETRSIALRLSPDPLIGAITQLLDFPIVATSANISGEPFFLNAQQIRAEFGEHLDMVIETDHELLQTPSTIITCSQEGELSLIREGAISLKELNACISPSSFSL